VAAEGGQVGGERLLVPDVGQHAAEGGQGGGPLCGQREARAGHEGSQAQRLHRGGLAAGVGACSRRGGGGAAVQERCTMSAWRRSCASVCVCVCVRVRMCVCVRDLLCQLLVLAGESKGRRGL